METNKLELELELHLSTNSLFFKWHAKYNFQSSLLAI